MKLIRAAWAWFVRRWRDGSTLVRIVLAILLPAAAVVVIGVAIPYELIARIDSSGRIPEVGRWAVSVLAFLIVAGLTTAISNTEDENRSSSPTASPFSRTATPQPSVKPSVGPTVSPVGSAALTDAAGDLKDADGDPARGPSYMDVLGVEASSRDGSLTVQIELADPPPLVDPLTEEVSYGFFIDVNNDGEGDFQVLVSNIVGGGQFEGSISNLDGGATQEGPNFPGEVEIAGSIVLVQVPLDAIGTPASLKVAVFGEWTFYPDPEGEPLVFDMVVDQAPDVIWPEDGGEWIGVGM